MSVVANDAIVWEWFDEHRRWRPYSPGVSNKIEIAQKEGVHRLNLGTEDPKMSHYDVDFVQKVQRRQFTGTERQIRRNLYPENGAVAENCFWYWEGDAPECDLDLSHNVVTSSCYGTFHQYDFEVAEMLETQYKAYITTKGKSKKLKKLDLYSQACRLPYIIDFKRMTQTRMETGRSRAIERRQAPDEQPYMRVKDVTAPKGKTPSTDSVKWPSRSKSSHTSSANSYAISSVVGTTFANTVPRSGRSTGSSFGQTMPSSGNHGSTHTAGSGVSRLGSLSSTDPGLKVPRLSKSGTSPPLGSRINPHDTSGATGTTFGQFMPPTGPAAFGHTVLGTPGRDNSVGPPTFGQSMPGMGDISTGGGGHTVLGQLMPGASNIPSFGTTLGHTGNNSTLGVAFGQTMPVLGSRPVTRSAVRQLTSATMTQTTPQDNITLPPGWHPPMALPGVTPSPAASAARHNKKRKKAVKPRLPPMGSYSNVNRVELGGAKSRKSKKSNSGDCFNGVVQRYASIIKHPPKDEDCCICMTELTEMSGQDENCSVIVKLKCSHMLHKSCLKAMYDSGTQDGSIQCPTCKSIFGVKFGNCPAGEMTYRKVAGSIPGYPHCGVIQIEYNIQPGKQGKEHPNPGERYVCQGFPRGGYLPDNEEGEQILRLLIKAWQRRLTFTVGTSVTTGQRNAVVWNEIHHKTEIQDHSGHGYPDPNYFSNVRMELAAQGVVDSESEEESEDSDDDL